MAEISPTGRTGTRTSKNKGVASFTSSPCRSRRRARSRPRRRSLRKVPELLQTLDLDAESTAADWGAAVTTPAPAPAGDESPGEPTVEPKPAWAPCASSNVPGVKYQVVGMKSLVWPGAFVAYAGGRFSNCYVGYGFQNKKFVPAPPPAVEPEFDLGGQLLDEESDYRTRRPRRWSWPWTAAHPRARAGGRRGSEAPAECRFRGKRASPRRGDATKIRHVVQRLFLFSALSRTRRDAHLARALETPIAAGSVPLEATARAVARASAARRASRARRGPRRRIDGARRGRRRSTTTRSSGASARAPTAWCTAAGRRRRARIVALKKVRMDKEKDGCRHRSCARWASRCAAASRHRHLAQGVVAGKPTPSSSCSSTASTTSASSCRPCARHLPGVPGEDADDPAPERGRLPALALHVFHRDLKMSNLLLRQPRAAEAVRPRFRGRTASRPATARTPRRSSRSGTARPSFLGTVELRHRGGHVGHGCISRSFGRRSDTFCRWENGDERAVARDRRARSARTTASGPGGGRLRARRPGPAERPETAIQLPAASPSPKFGADAVDSLRSSSSTPEAPPTDASASPARTGFLARIGRRRRRRRRDFRLPASSSSSSARARARTHSAHPIPELSDDRTGPASREDEADGGGRRGAALGRRSAAAAAQRQAGGAFTSSPRPPPTSPARAARTTGAGPRAAARPTRRDARARPRSERIGIYWQRHALARPASSSTETRVLCPSYALGGGTYPDGAGFAEN